MSGSNKTTTTDRPHALRAIAAWLVYSALFVGALLIFTRFRMVWLCVGAGLLLGFLTDCAVDVIAAKRHQREMRERYRKRFEAGDQS